MAPILDDLPIGQVRGPGDKIYMPRADGARVPIEMVKQKDRLQDEAVRRLVATARELEAAIASFKAQAFDDVDALQALLEQQYGAKVGGSKGNVSLFSYDGLIRIQVQISDLIKFGPELQVAEALLEECVGEWVEGARAELRAIVMNAFRRDKEGQLNRGALLGLRRYEVEDERWKRAMQAIADSIQVIGSKRYIRFSSRPTLDGAWAEVSLNIASAKPPLATPLT